MKKAVFVIVFTCVLAMFATCASAKMVIKLANAGPENPDNRTVKAVEIFKYNVEKRTNGALEVLPQLPGNSLKAISGRSSVKPFSKKPAFDVCPSLRTVTATLQTMSAL